VILTRLDRDGQTSLASENWQFSLAWEASVH
jgi:hypothetical protein